MRLIVLHILLQNKDFIKNQDCLTMRISTFLLKCSSFLELQKRLNYDTLFENVFTNVVEVWPFTFVARNFSFGNKTATCKLKVSESVLITFVNKQGKVDIIDLHCLHCSIYVPKWCFDYELEISFQINPQILCVKPIWFISKPIFLP